MHLGSGQGHSVLRRYQGQPVRLVGGLQITVDLAGAFDAMPRQYLLEGLLSTGLPAKVIDVIMQWHQQAQYDVSHADKPRKMSISHPKSKAFPVCRGKGAESIKRRHIRKTQQGKVLRFVYAQEIIDIPIVDIFVYLGAVTSYGPFEDQTLGHRMQVGTANFWRLERVLRSRHSLSKTNRLNTGRMRPDCYHMWTHGTRTHAQRCQKADPWDKYA